MNELITALAFAWRTFDGRNEQPTGRWNVWLFVGLALLLALYTHFNHITALQALVIYAVVLTYILTGYKSLTLPWVVYQYRLFKSFIYACKAKYRYFRNCETEEIYIEEWGKAEKRLLGVWHIKEVQFEHNNGFHTWHMSYRYVIAGCMICAILNTWSVTYLIACSVAGLLFPLRVRYWNTEASARLTEGILGAVIIGGWTWLI